MYDVNKISKDREAFWSNIHDKYYLNNHKVAKKRRDYIAKIVANNEIGSVLELGCHDGINLKHIEDAAPNVKTEGIDICKKAIDFGKNKLKVNADMRVQSIYDLSNFKDNSYDLVFTCTCLIHIPSERISNILQEMCRISKKFVINIEDNGAENKIYWMRDGVPQRFVTNYVSIYKDMGYDPKIYDMLDLCGEALGGANHLIYASLGQEMIMKLIE